MITKEKVRELIEWAEERATSKKDLVDLLLENLDKLENE